MKQIEIEVLVIEQTESGKALKCSMREDGGETFFLPKGQIKPIGKVKKGQKAKFSMPEWLYLKHRQMCGDEAFEAEKSRREAYEKSKNWQEPIDE